MGDAEAGWCCFLLRRPGSLFFFSLRFWEGNDLGPRLGRVVLGIVLLMFFLRIFLGWGETLKALLRDLS